MRLWLNKLIHAENTINTQYSIASEGSVVYVLLYIYQRAFQIILFQTQVNFTRVPTNSATLQNETNTQWHITTSQVSFPWLVTVNLESRPSSCKFWILTGKCEQVEVILKNPHYVFNFEIRGKERLPYYLAFLDTLFPMFQATNSFVDQVSMVPNYTMLSQQSLIESRNWKVMPYTTLLVMTADNSNTFSHVMCLFHNNPLYMQNSIAWLCHLKCITIQSELYLLVI